ncbi:hypothetical protein MD484_g2846, partial [Candolleomyces efflorescens]
MSISQRIVYAEPTRHAIWPPRRNAVDFHASNDVPKDHWHHSMKTKTVCERPDHCFGIFFHSKGDYLSATATLGVALTLCEYPEEGVEMPNTPTHTLLPAEIIAKPKSGILITWPGYQHLRIRREIFLNTTTGDLARQIARIFRDFYELYHPDFKGPGIRLGPSFMTFDSLRLRSMFWDGRFWNLEIDYVYENTPVYDFV